MIVHEMKAPEHIEVEGPEYVKRYRCVCGQELAEQASFMVFSGEIRHYRYSCAFGHAWERTQIGWTQWGWTWLGEMQELMALCEEGAVA